MPEQTRLNLLLTHGAGSEQRPGVSADLAERQPWYRTVSHVLSPLGVRTFEATTGQEAMAVIEREPIHLAVVDTQLPGVSGLGVARLIQKMQQRAAARQSRFSVQVDMTSHQAGQTRQVQVRFEQRQVVSPTVILLTPEGTAESNSQVLQEALTFGVYSVLSQPVQLDMVLEVMARAMKRFYENQWPLGLNGPTEV